MSKPTTDLMYPYVEAAGELENYSPAHPLNTEAYKKKQMNQDDITCYAFFMDNQRKLMFSGYGDGLICIWQIESLQPSEFGIPSVPMIGHTNKINAIEIVQGKKKVFSCSNDCTLRQWSIETKESYGICEKIFKFTDPTLCVKMHMEKSMLFVGCWDRQVRALDYETGQVDRAWLAANSAIRTMHLHEDWLFTGSLETQIRAFNLETGACKSYEGHESWVNCMATHFVYDAEGNIKNTWLLSGSDDSSILIWDMASCKRLEKLQEHKNGVMCLALTPNTPCDSLYSGGQDHFTIFWDMKVIEQRIFNISAMEREDLLSRKSEAFYGYLEAKYGKKRGKKGKGKGKKGKKGK